MTGPAARLESGAPAGSWRAGVVPAVWLFGHSALMTAASPIATTVGLWPFAVVAMIPCLVAARKLANSSFRAVLVAALGFVPWWLVTHAWLLNVTIAGVVFLPFILAAFDAVAVYATARLTRSYPALGLVAFPILWTGLNFFRGEIAMHGYAWGWVSHPLIDAPWLAAPACLVGTYGITFLLASLASAIVHAANTTGPKRLAAPLAVGLAWAVLSWIGLEQSRSAVGTDPVQIAIVQTNVPMDNKLDWTVDQENRDFERFRDLTMRAVADTPDTLRRPDLIVWPETMAPGMTLAPQGLKALNDNNIFVRRADGSRQWATYFADSLLDMSQAVATPLIVGASYIDNLVITTDADDKVRMESDARYNAAFVLRDGKIERQWYFKQHLTPFGEVMPYISNWPWLERQLLSIGAKGMSFDLASGTEPTILTVPTRDGRTLRCVAPICFESTNSRLLRRLVYADGARRADVIVNLTNDGWFTFSDLTRRQHLQAARWRSLETLTPTVRAANTGVSAFIGFDGSLLASGIDGHPDAVDIDGLLTGSLTFTDRVPPFALTGNTLGFSCCLLSGVSLVGIGWRAFRRRKRGRHPDPGDASPQPKNPGSNSRSHVPGPPEPT